jgi:membrane-associated protease RseP (regulator of RpoE activity)
MTGPKHLWSGDWQQESAAASDLHTARKVQLPEPEPKPKPEPEPEPRASPPAPARSRARVSQPSRPRHIRAVSIVAGALLLTAAAAFALIALTNPAGSPAPVSAVVAPRPVSWLGMQIETVPPGAAVIETVKLGSPGELAGLSPGDVLVAINHRSINGTGDIGAAISGLHAGDQVELEVSHGSGLYTTVATLAAPPSSHP